MPTRGDWSLALALMLGVAMTTALPVLASPRISATGAPDLVPTEMGTSPDIIHENEIVQLSVTIVNQGDMEAWAATVRFMDSHPDGPVLSLGESSLPARLDPGKSVVLSHAFVVAGVGNHTITAHVVDVIPTESNTSNNFLFRRLTVQPAESNPGIPPPSNTLGIEALQGLGIGGLVAIVILAIAGWTISLGARRPPDDTLVPPPPEPPDRRPPPIWPP